MSESYIGEIRMFAGNYAPQGWAMCNGQLMSIAENEALYSLLGTTFGGDGQTTFGLPDLRGRLPVHPSPQIPQGVKAGTETVTLVPAQLPTHTHQAMASTDAGDLTSPANAVWAGSNWNSYSNGAGQTVSSMNIQSISFVGGNQPHDNMMPSTVISFIISLNGVYPTQE